MMKITKKDMKEFWEGNKTKIIIGGSVVVGGVGLFILKHKFKDVNVGNERNKNIFGKCLMPSRPIPEIEGFTISDIAEDVNEGCVVWIDGCKLSDCGKLGEGLSKIEGVTPEMILTMAILAKDEVE